MLKAFNLNFTMTRLILLIYCCLPLLLTAQPGWLVRYAPGQTRSSLSQFPATVQEKLLYPGSRWQRWHFEQVPTPEQLARLKADPAIATIEREVRYRSQHVPNDPGFAEQWALQNTGQTGGPRSLDLRAPDAWAYQTGSPDITIAVVDAGIDWRHPDLIDNIWQNLAEDADGDGAVLVWNGTRWEFDPGDINGIDDDGNGYVDDFIGWDFVNDDNDPSDDHQFGHGTHVAGIIAARGNNGIGIAGVSWRSKLMPLKFLAANGSGFTGDAIAALQYARQMGADISNHSWGGGLYSQALGDELLLAQQAGMLCVAAAGNNFGNDNDEAPLYPASYELDNLISVSASDPVDSLAPFANHGLNSVDLCAPGYGIYSTLPGGRYGYLNGTSMAAPFVTGALALLMSQQPGLDMNQLRQRLLRSIRPRPGLRGTCATEGRLDLLPLLQRPLLFQRELAGSVHAGTSLPDGRILAAGEYQGDLWVSCLQPDGQVSWSRHDQAGQWNAATEAPSGSSLLGGNAGGVPLLTRLDSLGQTLWTQQLDWGAPASLTQLVSDGLAGIWAAGWYLNGSDTAVWLARLDFDGQEILSRRYFLSGQHLRPTALALGENDAPAMLLRVGANASAWMRIDPDGDLIQAEQVAWSGVTATLAQQIWADEDEWYLSGQLELGSGERQLFVLEWESDEGFEEVELWLLGQTSGSSISGPGHAQQRWLLSAGAGSQGPGIRLVQLGSEEEDQIHRSYAWPGEAVQPVWVGTPRPGLLGWLLKRPGGGSYWGQADEQGNSLCFVDSVSFAPINGVEPDISPLNLTELATGGSLSLATLTPSGPLPPPTLLCDNSQCEVQAFFTLPALEICEEGLLIPDNLSENASGYQWWLDGELIDTLANPLLEAPDDEGAYELLLVASDGPCTDSFRVPLLVEPPLELTQQDTIHCGPRLSLAVPEAHEYRWLNEDDSLLSQDRTFTFEQSGRYTLELINTCGESVEQNFEVTLQGNCIWPGDVSADGVVDMVDYLLLGMVHGQTGPARPNASSGYTPQIASPWSDSFATDNPWAPGVNLAHADANGDGVVDAESDGALVRRHYGASELPRMAPDPNAAVEVGLQLDTMVVQSGDTVEFRVELTTPDGQPIPEAYGLALTLETSIPLSRPMQVSPRNSWITAGGIGDTLVLNDPGGRQLRVGLNRLDQVPAAPASGLVMTGIIIVVIDDIGSYGPLAERGFLSIAVTEALLIRPDGREIALNPLGTQAARTLEVRRDSSSTVGLPTESKAPLSFFPNPTQGHLQVKGQSHHGPDRSWRICNLQGQVRLSGTWPAQESLLSLDLTHLPSGYYLLQVEQNDQVHHARVVVRK